MTPLRIAVLMKTDIAGSTPRFRALLASDQQTLLHEHRALVSRHAVDHGGSIIQLAGDGYWLEFPSVTDAAKAGIAMQEALRLAQPNRGDDRVSIRVVIGVGDIAVMDGVPVGDAIPQIVRIEKITPKDQIYLTAAARSALTPAEIQTALVDTVLLQGFAEPITVYRIEQRHRTRIIPDAYILISDLRGFGRLIEAAPVTAIERVLNVLDTLTFGVAQEFGGTVHYSVGDSYCVAFPLAAKAMAAAEQLSRDWENANHEDALGCAINLALHRSTICTFRSFVYGKGMMAAERVQAASKEVLASSEGGVFVTDSVWDDLSGSSWHIRLRPVTLKGLEAQCPGLKVYQLNRAPSD
ncbi:MAG TPA: adenylate/guanylate cyclase domain-containing protein [Rhodopila sp.]|nr:adenylate/guanylate cyclase domain-containing protein [Rhodopila sp.]